MQLLARLVHVEPGIRVVSVTARRDGQMLACALGEGANAEDAEDRAVARLLQRLQRDTAQSANAGLGGPVSSPSPALENQQLSAGDQHPNAAKSRSVKEQPIRRQPTEEAAEPTLQTMQEPQVDPEDWSGELTEIEMQLRRLGWDRDQEAAYLERAFGHPSRSRITTYSSLQGYLQALQQLEAGSDPAVASVPLRRPELLQQCEQLLTRLGWTAHQGRHHLEQHFQLSSRQQLSDPQLLKFNMLLEEQLIDQGKAAATKE